MKVENIKSNIPKLNICVRHMNHYIKPCKIAQLHYHDELEFLPVFNGTFCCKVDGIDYIAHAGEIIFINSGVPHETECLEPETRSGLLQFRESSYLDRDIQKVIKYSVKFQNLDGAPVLILKSKEIYAAISRIFIESQEKQNAYEVMIKSHILRIIAQLYRDGILSDGEQVYASAAVQKILPAMMYINQHYGEEVTLEAVSGMMGFDRSYFCRIFKSATGATFTEYLNFVRICKAEKMLSSTTRSILDISADVGFCSVSYFNKLFKKYKNCSPSFYRTAKYCNNI